MGVVLDKIRRVTPLECWRLQGFSDQSFYKAEKVNSDTQLYKQAGNSITVDVVKKIIKNIYK
jgi:DNA (cytosine-5)-methyltransferase 1